MVGVIRKERSKANGPYSRKVHFQLDTDEISVTATPTKQSTPTLVAGAETHRLQKRRGASAARRRSGGLDPIALVNEEIERMLNQSSDPYPKTPVKRRKTRATRSLGEAMSIDNIIPDASVQKHEEYPSSPFGGKTMGMPDISDFSDMPDVSFLDKALSASFAHSPNAMNEDRHCRCAELEGENHDLRRKYEKLDKKHKDLLVLLKDAREQIARSNRAHEMESKDEMLCEADDESEHHQRSSGAAQPSGSVNANPFSLAPKFISSFPTPSTSSTSSTSSMGAQPETPAEHPALPLRVIDEDYDEGYDGRAVLVQGVRMRVAHLLDGLSTAETLDRLANALSRQWNINDTSDTPPSIVFPPLPKFDF